MSNLERTTWDSVYSAPQAARGGDLYGASCAACHGATLAGTDSAAELVGRTFLGNWDGLPLDQLYDKILTSMPPDKPNSLKPAQVADLVAYMLAKNQFPAGQRELSAESDSLKAIVMRKNRP